MAYDIIVVGARCAGASVARLMAAAGIRVLLIDRSAFPSDTISTHCITPPGLRQLVRWGLLQEIVATSAPIVRTLNLEVDNAPKPEIFGTGQGAWTFAPRRAALDSVLIEAASKAGATVWQRTKVSRVLADQNGMRVIGAHESGHLFEETADLIIGADGRQSTVARDLSASIQRTLPSRLGGWYAYYLGMPVDITSWTFGRSTSAGSFPTNDGLACVWSMCDTALIPRGRRDRQSWFLSTLRATNDQLFEEVSAAERASRLVSFGRYPGFMRARFGRGWALVGDAGYFAHPITAHGISDAFRDAQLLTEAVYSTLNGDCLWIEAAKQYTDRQEAATQGAFKITQKIASLNWSLADVVDLLMSYKAGVQTTLTLEDSWWGTCDLTLAI